MTTKYTPPHLRGNVKLNNKSDGRYEISHSKTGSIKEKHDIFELPGEIKIDGQKQSKNATTVIAEDNSIVEPIIIDEWKEERTFFRKLAKIRRVHYKKNREEEYIRWLEHYDTELQLMYDNCVPPELLISYERFTRLAHENSLTRLDIFNNIRQ